MNYCSFIWHLSTRGICNSSTTIRELWAMVSLFQMKYELFSIKYSFLTFGCQFMPIMNLGLPWPSRWHWTNAALLSLNQRIVIKILSKYHLGHADIHNLNIHWDILAAAFSGEFINNMRKGRGRGYGDNFEIRIKWIEDQKIVVEFRSRVRFSFAN